MSLIKIATQNCRGLFDLKKRVSIFEYHKQHNLDVVMIQEAHFNSNIECQWKISWLGEGNILYYHSQSRGAGQIILLKDYYNVHEHEVIIQGRLQRAVIEVNQLKTLFNINSPNIDKYTFIINFLITLRKAIRHTYCKKWLNVNIRGHEINQKYYADLIISKAKTFNQAV